MKKSFQLVLLTLTLTLFAYTAKAELDFAFADTPRQDSIYQVSTIQALQEGKEMIADFATLAQNGNFGFGTVDGLGGVMIALDGNFFLVKSRNHVAKITPETTTPFAMLTRFSIDFEEELQYIKDLEDLKQRLLKKLPNPALFYALRMDGSFQYIKATSVPLHKKALDENNVFELNETFGTILGFFVPEFMATVSQPGFHFYYLDGNETHGGRILDLCTRELVVDIDRTPHFFVKLPISYLDE